MKLPSEYQVLRYFESHVGPATSTEVAEAFGSDAKMTIETNKWLRDEGYLKGLMHPVNGVDTMAYQITPAGKRLLREIRINRFLFAMTTVNTITAIVSLIVAIHSLFATFS